MPAPRDPELLAKAARLYFLDDRSQDDVAAILGTTRSNVSRMVRQARNLGIVEIRIVAPAQRDHELELALRDRYPLADARVLEVGAETEVLAGVGRLAAHWLDETLRDGQVVALSWGHSLQAMVRAVDLARRDVEVVQLVGGLSALDSAVTGQELVRELSERIGARHRYLHAPALFGSAEALTLLRRSRPSPARWTRPSGPTWRSSASAPPASAPRGRCWTRSPSARPSGPPSTPPGPSATSAVASTTCPAGRCRSVVNQRVLAVTLDDLRAIPTVAGIAAGPEKALGILGALRGGIIDVLICDQQAARSVLRLDGGT